MRQNIDCLQQARHIEQVCSHVFEIIHHKNYDKQYVPTGTDREAIYKLLRFIQPYEKAPPHSSALDCEVEYALEETCSNCAQGVELIQGLLQFLIDDKLPTARLTEQEIKKAKRALFDISQRVNQLIEPESY